jgi:hypothetical protein
MRKAETPHADTADVTLNAMQSYLFFIAGQRPALLPDVYQV